MGIHFRCWLGYGPSVVPLSGLASHRTVGRRLRHAGRPAWHADKFLLPFDLKTTVFGSPIIEDQH